MNCYCLCGVLHPQQPGICTGVATTREKAPLRIKGPVKLTLEGVPMCEACADTIMLSERADELHAQDAS